ncbi:MAG: hypothetical protein ACYDG6_06830 [Thermincolia bacterium]
MGWREEHPSVKQLNYAKSLAEEIGIENRYVWLQTNWTKGELSDLINELKERLGYE